MSDYWASLIAEFGRKTLYVDTAAILGDLSPNDGRFRDFFESTAGFTYVTSTYVVTETVRRLVKSKTPNKFIGPSGERCKDLSLYILKTWLDHRDVRTICLPREQYDAAGEFYTERSYVQCDLTDVISAMIVQGMERDVILSDDEHFRRLDLQLLP